jgi:hypothetical protein
MRGSRGHGHTVVALLAHEHRPHRLDHHRARRDVVEPFRHLLGDLLLAPSAGARELLVGRHDEHALARQVLGERLAARRTRTSTYGLAGRVLGPLHALARRRVRLGGSLLRQLSKGEGQLVRAHLLGALAEEPPAQLVDLLLQKLVLAQGLRELLGKGGDDALSRDDGGVGSFETVR